MLLYVTVFPTQTQTREEGTNIYEMVYSKDFCILEFITIIH